MNGQHQDPINDLQSQVAALSNNLAASERRAASLERSIRWGATGALAVLGLALIFGFNLLGSAIAQPASGEAQSQPATVVEALNQINGNLRGLGMMTQMMEFTMQGAIYRAIEEQNENHQARQAQGHDQHSSVADSPLGNYVEEFTKKQCDILASTGSDPALPSAAAQEHPMPMNQFCKLYTDDYLTALPLKASDRFPIVGEDEKLFRMSMAMLYQQAIMEATGNVLVDAGVLMYRVREDSNLLRGLVDNIGGPNKLLEGIRTELQMMNRMLSSIPVMTTQMDAMTRQMGVMSHSMGSTMGRAGNWIPW